MTYKDSPAYPETHVYHWRGEDKEVGVTDNVLPRYQSGLSKREYFSALAMQGDMADGTRGYELETRAPLWIAAADALIAELNKSETKGDSK